MDSAKPPSTWGEALEKYAIVEVRAFEKRLRASALRDREKVRALVGSNYRDLLDTAEQIVELDRKVPSAESNIAALGHACVPPTFETTAAQPPARVIALSHLKLIDSMLRCTAKATKEKSVLLASRLIVLSRLLIKHLEQANGLIQSLQWLQSRHKTVRQRLLACLDGILVRPTTPLQGLYRAVAAYCLTTSSASADALKHFQALRGARLAQRDSETQPSTPSISRSSVGMKCQYLIATVTAIKALSGRGVSEILANLQKHPIFEDSSLAKLDTLQLDFHRPLLPSDILSFTPYFKRQVLSPSEVRNIYQAWVDEHVSYVVRDLRDLLSNLKLTGVLHMRKEIMNIFMPVCFSTLLHTSSLGTVRAVFSERIEDLVQTQASGLKRISDTLPRTEQGADETFWRSDLVRHMHIRRDDSNLISVQSQRLGLSQSPRIYLQRLNKWTQAYGIIHDELNNLTRIRWQDKIEEYDDEDEEVANEIVTGLSKDDPQQYRRAYDAALLEAAGQFVATLSAEAEKVVQQDVGPITAGQISTLLRVFREAKVVLDAVGPSKISTKLVEPMNVLWKALADQVAAQLFSTMESKEPAGSLIFQTDDLPTPLTVSMLQTLSMLMMKNGGIDLWNNTPTRYIRRAVLQRALSDEYNRFYVRSDLDKAYLTAALGGEHPASEAWSEQITRRAAMYWNRTKSLYGILAVEEPTRGA
ncbi:hypothetical protein LTS08_006212 [Lithohypha guttulata]|nr:hypothetical protein LTS08_006212 [Lithohypha guttulata]